MNLSLQIKYHHATFTFVFSQLILVLGRKFLKINKIYTNYKEVTFNIKSSLWKKLKKSHYIKYLQAFLL